MRRSETALFLPHRAIGEICSSVKPAYKYYAGNKQGFVFCAVHNVVCVYSVQPLRLINVTSALLSDIRLVACNDEYLFAVAGNTISVFSVREQLVREIVTNKSPKCILPFGKALVVVDINNKIEVFEAESGESILEIESPARFKISALVHPITYINQIVAGAEDGRMRILNLETGTLIREFPSDDNFNSAITVLEQSPAVDVLAIGLANGRIHLKNMKVDRIICSFRQDGSITALTFRTDGIDTLLSGNSEGSVAVWDLNEKMLIGQKTDMHKGPVVSLHFLLGQAFMFSSGEDNRLVKWVLKDEFSLPELRSSLEGPSMPVTSVSFYGSQSLLVASKDGCMRYVESIYGNNMRMMGVGREVKKGDLSKDRFIDVRLSPIVRMVINRTREAVWDNVICQHEDSPLVSTWSTRRHTQGAHLLYHKRFKNNPKYVSSFVTSICLSCCGNFAIVGYSSGHLDVFNMQSGKHRQSFWYSGVSKKSNDEDDLLAHSSAVTGIVLDITNENLVSGSADGSIHFWSFSPLKLISRVHVACGVSKFRLDRYNSLLAVALGNGELAIVDVLCRRVARQFKNAHAGCKVTALNFSHDGKWIVSADNKCMIKVWDLSTGTLIDAMKCSLVCLDVSFNESGQYIATCHEGQRSVYFWVNKSLFFSSFSAQLFTQKSGVVVRKCNLPGLSAMKDVGNKNPNDESDDDEMSENNCRLVVIDEEEEEEELSTADVLSLSDQSAHQEENSSFVEKVQLEPLLLTLSGLAPSRWANLPNLDLIRQRNKPIEPPKKLKNAPFFLPTTETLDGFVFESIADEETEKENLLDSEKTLMGKRKLADLETPWARSLMNAENNAAELIAVFAALKEMNISSIDFQIRTLNLESFMSFLRMLICVLELKQDFELVQSYLATFLNIHYELLWSGFKMEIKQEDEEHGDEYRKEKEKRIEQDKGLTEALSSIYRLQEGTWTELQNLLDANCSIAMWIKCSLI